MRWGDFIAGCVVGANLMFIFMYRVSVMHVNKWRCWENDDGSPKKEANT